MFTEDERFDATLGQEERAKLGKAWGFLQESVKVDCHFRYFESTLRFLVEVRQRESHQPHCPSQSQVTEGSDGQHAPNGGALAVFLSSRAAAVARPCGSCLGRSLMLGAHEVCATVSKRSKSSVLLMCFVNLFRISISMG